MGHSSLYFLGFTSFKFVSLRSLLLHPRFISISRWQSAIQRLPSLPTTPSEHILTLATVIPMHTLCMVERRVSGERRRWRRKGLQRCIEGLLLTSSGLAVFESRL
jgi:hypothetical protein